MALKEALNNFVQHLRQGPRNDMEGTQAASLSNGGYTGWHPIPEKKKNREVKVSGPIIHFSISYLFSAASYSEASHDITSDALPLCIHPRP